MTDLRNLCESLARICNATQDELIGIVYETLADLGRVAVPVKPSPTRRGRRSRSKP